MKKTKRLNIKLTEEDKKKVEYLVKKAKTDKSKVVRNLISNAYNFIKSATNEKN